MKNLVILIIILIIYFIIFLNATNSLFFKILTLF